MFRSIENLFSQPSAASETELREVLTAPTEELTKESAVSKPIAIRNPHQREPFLTDELRACIHLLEEALDDARSKVIRSYIFDIRLLLMLLSIGGVVALSATRPLYSIQIRARDERDDYQPKVANAAIALNNSLNSFCAGINTTICNSLTQYKDAMTSWWSMSFDNGYRTYWQPTKNGVCSTGSCSHWGYYSSSNDHTLHPYDWCNDPSPATMSTAEDFVTEKYPAIRDGDFCALYRSNPNYSDFSKCNMILANLCELTNSIGLLLQNSTSPDRYAAAFSQEQQLSQLQARLNYATAETHTTWPDVLGIGGAVVCGISAAALLGVYIFACRACKNYKDSLKEIDDVYECIEDPYVLNRLLNLAERYDLSLTRESPEGSTEEPKG